LESKQEKQWSGSSDILRAEMEARQAAESQLALLLIELKSLRDGATQSQVIAEEETIKSKKQIERLKSALGVQERKVTALSLRCEELTQLLQDHQNVFSNLLQNKSSAKALQQPSNKKKGLPYCICKVCCVYCDVD
jgi:hypothetical protein